jgi:hypothetical protein
MADGAFAGGSGKTVTAFHLAQREQEEAKLLKPTAEAVTEALRLLWDCAQRDTGQSEPCARFLLGLYNGPNWPFDMTLLRGLDYALQNAVLLVLRNDMIYTPREIHTYLFDTSISHQAANDAFAAMAQAHGLTSRVELREKLEQLGAWRQVKDML